MNQENSKKATSGFEILEEMKNINLANESLKPMEPETDYISMMQKFKDILNNKDSDWTLQIGVINCMRRIFKFEKQVFSQFFYGAKFYQKIIELINSVRSSLAKNVLILFNEIFSGPMPNQEEKANTTSLIAVIKTTIPHLISKINSNKSFIKNDANICLESLIQNMKYFEVLHSFMQLMNTKKSKDSELCAELSIKMIKSLGKEFFVKNTQFGELMKCVVSLYEAQKNANLKKCKNILNCFVEIMGKEEFDKKMEKCTKKEKDNVKIIMEAKVTEVRKKSVNSSSLHFHKEIRERKRTFMLSKCNNNNINKGNKSVTIKLIPKGKDTMNIVPKTLKLNDENVVKNY